MAKITIDGQEYDVPPMKFKTLKKAFPIVQKLSGVEDSMELADGAIQIMSLAMVKDHPEMTPDWLEENLSVAEAQALPDAITQMLTDSGLISAEGLVGLTGGNAPTPPSTETSIPLSANSSQPDAPEAIGT